MSDQRDMVNDDIALVYEAAYTSAYISMTNASGCPPVKNSVQAVTGWPKHCGSHQLASRSTVGRSSSSGRLAGHPSGAVHQQPGGRVGGGRRGGARASARNGSAAEGPCSGLGVVVQDTVEAAVQAVRDVVVLQGRMKLIGRCETRRAVRKRYALWCVTTIEHTNPKPSLPDPGWKTFGDAAAACGAREH